MRDAKKGQFYMTDPHRSVANNSAVYETQPTNDRTYGRMGRADEERQRRARHLQSRVARENDAETPLSIILKIGFIDENA